MAAARKFDHDEARRRFQASESVSVLAVEFGVTKGAIYQVISPRQRESARRAQAAYYERHRVPCETCGKSVLCASTPGKREHNPDGRSLCVRCRADEKRERLRFDESGALVAVRCHMVDCANGDRWQLPENFTRGAAHREVREGGIHGSCRSCQTRQRTNWRHRHADQQRAYDRARKRRLRNKVAV